MFSKATVAIIAMCLAGTTACYSQAIDSTADNITSFPAKFFDRISGKATRLDQQVTQQTQKYLRKMARQEQRLCKQLYKMDSTAAKTLFTGASQRYAAIEQRLATADGHGTSLGQGQGPYLAYVDSMQTCLSFFRKNPQFTADPGVQTKLDNSIQQFSTLQAKLKAADQAQTFIQQRRAQIIQYLQRYTGLPSSLTSTLSSYKQTAYYYSQQLQSYKEELNDPDKLFKAGLQALDRVPAFASFAKKNSMLAGILNIPSTQGTAVAGTGNGMSSREKVMESIPGADGPNGSQITSALQGNLQSAQDQVGAIQSKLTGLGGSSGGDLEVPDFKPNDQKTKSFFHRLQLGVNLQTNHSTLFYPTTTNLGLSLGYKLNSKNVIGFGASYNLGWTGNLGHIQVNGQGIGLRSFIDIQIKGTWFASGGFEYNYQKPFTIQGISIKNLDDWQKSGLIGISKIVSMKTRVFKNTKLQLLWDFLSYQQMPQAQPLIFRLGYAF